MNLPGVETLCKSREAMLSVCPDSAKSCSPFHNTTCSPSYRKPRLAESAPATVVHTEHSTHVHKCMFRPLQFSVIESYLSQT